MEYIEHEYANIYPLMQEDELKELAQSIKTNGLLQPIKLYEGKILDGRNRYWACQKVGIEPIFEQWQGTPVEAILYITDLNEKRRHLTSSQRAACAVEREELLRTIITGNRNAKLANLQKGSDRHHPNTQKFGERDLHKNDKHERETDAQLAKMAGTNRQYITDIKKIKEKHPDMFLDVKFGRKSISETKKDITRLEREEVRQKRLVQAQNIVIPQNIEIYQGDCLELSQSLPVNSIDAIITDPPYPYEYIDCWSKLGQIGARVLKPGGFCIAYSGIMFLPEVMNRLSAHLEYYWQIALVHQGQKTTAYHRNAIRAYKPILIFVKPPVEACLLKKNRTHFLDVIEGSGREKALHEWQQAEDELTYIFEKFTEEGNTILDPFAGSGTTLAVAHRQRRHAIGYEINGEYIDIIKTRLCLGNKKDINDE